MTPWDKDAAGGAQAAGDAGRPPVIAFVGHSGSGKTTLLLRVVPELQARGARVTVIKHSSHRNIETDVPGSDTRRLWDVGAEQVALVAPDRIALSRRLRVELTLQEVLESVVTVGTESPTLVLVEGYKRSRVPKIEVIRAACNPQPLQDLEHRLACVTDVSGLTLDCPMLALNDVAGVVELLLSYAEGGA